MAAASGEASADCDASLFMPTTSGRLVALDPAIDAVCNRFGQARLCEHP